MPSFSVVLKLKNGSRTYLVVQLSSNIYSNKLSNTTSRKHQGEYTEERRAYWQSGRFDVDRVQGSVCSQDTKQSAIRNAMLPFVGCFL